MPTTTTTEESSSGSSSTSAIVTPNEVSRQIQIYRNEDDMYDMSARDTLADSIATEIRASVRKQWHPAKTANAYLFDDGVFTCRCGASHGIGSFAHGGNIDDGYYRVFRCYTCLRMYVLEMDLKQYTEEQAELFH